MKPARRQLLQLMAGAAVLPAAQRIAKAQAYPTRPITIIVPFAPGGGTDVSARLVGEHMSRTLGQQFVIENFPGAGGTTDVAPHVHGGALKAYAIAANERSPSLPNVPTT